MAKKNNYPLDFKYSIVGFDALNKSKRKHKGRLGWLGLSTTLLLEYQVNILLPTSKLTYLALIYNQADTGALHDGDLMGCTLKHLCNLTGLYRNHAYTSLIDLQEKQLLNLDIEEVTSTKKVPREEKRREEKEKRRVEREEQKEALETKSKPKKKAEPLQAELLAKQSLTPRVPFEKRVHWTCLLWNKHVNSELPRVRSYSTQRAKMVKAILKEYPDQATWIEVFEMINASEFLQGVSVKGWRCNFEWLVKSVSNFTKVLEGNYANNHKKLDSKQKIRTHNNMEVLRQIQEEDRRNGKGIKDVN